VSDRFEIPPGFADELWNEDKKRNHGIALELMSASGYAERLSITLAEYVIMVLRDERLRVQEIDHIAQEAALMDTVIDGARAAGMTVADYITSGEFLPEAGPTTTWKISPDFFARLLTRYQERYGPPTEARPTGSGH
jgi:hypothetical protein